MNENNVDKEKLDYLFNLIRMYEGNNLRTNKNDDDAMIKIIEKEIRKIVDKEEQQHEI
jgi:hypothetical protein